MATTQVTLPTGKTVGINHPDNATDDQVLGYAKQQFDAGAFHETGVGDYARSLGQGLTFGFGDEVEAYARSLVSGKPYEQEVGEIRGEMKQFEAANPYAALGTEIAGSLATPGGLLKLPGALSKLAALSKTSSTLGKLVKGGAGGAATGALYGAGKTEAELGSDTFDNAALEGAIVGGMFGTVAQGAFQALHGLGRGVKALATRAEDRPTVNSVKALKTEAYKEFGKVAEVADPVTVLPSLTNAAKKVAADRQYRPNLNPETGKVLKELDDIVARGETYTVAHLDDLRSDLYQVANRAGGKDGIIIRDIAHTVDDYIDDLISRSPNVSPDTAKIARDLNKQYMKMKMLDESFTKASHGKAPTHVAYKTAVQSILKNPSRLRFFTKDEVDAMHKFVKGGLGQRTVEYIARYSPGSNSLASLLQLTHVAINPKMAGLTAAAGVSQVGADIATASAAKGLTELMGGRKPALPPTTVIPQSPVGLMGAEYSEPR